MLLTNYFTMPMVSGIFFDPVSSPECSKWARGEPFKTIFAFLYFCIFVCFSGNFGRFASYVGLSAFLRATVRFFVSWHHVCWKRCGKRTRRDPIQEKNVFFSCPFCSFRWIRTIHYFNKRSSLFYPAGCIFDRSGIGWLLRNRVIVKESGDC